MLRPKKAVGALVVVGLLMLVSILLYFQVYQWFGIFKGDLQEDVYAKDLDRNLEITMVDGTNIYVKNNYGNELQITQLKIGGNTCNVTDELPIDKGLAIIDIGSCTLGLSATQRYDVFIMTDEGIKNEYEIVKNPVDNPFIVLYQTSSCDFSAGYTRLFGASSNDNAMAGLGPNAYNVCIRNLDYSVGNATTGNFVTLLFINDVNNSHVFTNTSSIYIAPSTWYNISISSNGGTFTKQIGGARPNLNYSCIGKIVPNDVYGSHIGDCASTDMNTTIWLRLQ